MVRMPKNKAKISSRIRNVFLTKNSRTASIIYWVTTLLTFGITLVIINMFLEKDTIVAGTNLSLALLLLNIILGIVSFVTIFLNSSKNKKNTKLPFYVKNAIFISIGYIFLNSVIFVSAGYKEKINRQISSPLKESAVYISIPTTIPEPTSTPTTSPKPINRVIPTAIPTGDKLTKCHIHEECGGGTREITEKECKELVCCGVNGKYFLISGKNECDKLQATSSTSNEVEMVAVTLPHNGKMVYCPKGIDAQAYNLSLQLKETIEYFKTIGSVFDEDGKVESKLNDFMSSNKCKY